MSRRISSYLMLSMAVCASTEARTREERPNFIIILADDMGYGDIQCNGNEYISTPHINSLAKGGMLFTDGHSNSALSTPSRAALYTGQYQQRSGLEGVILENIPEHEGAGIPGDRTTFADILSKNGYDTCLLGKWHLGSCPEYHPLNFGFKHFEGFLTGNVDYFTRVNNKRVLDWWNGRETERIDGYTTSILTSKAINYITSHKDKPFCLVISEACPHGPLQGPEDYPLRIEHQKPASLKIMGKSQKDIYKSMIEELDNGIGDILQVLKTNGLQNKTLIIFMSDNGPKTNNDCGSAYPFRDGKGSMFEGGHRVPFIAYMPGTISSGSISDTPVMGFDIFPTILEMSGIKNIHELRVDGTSLVPLFEGNRLKSRTLYWALGNRRAIRQDNWKLVIQNVRKNDEVIQEEYLFDIKNDFNEQNNLIERFPDKVFKLKKKLASWYEDVTSGHKEQLVQHIPSMSF